MISKKELNEIRIGKSPHRRLFNELYTHVKQEDFEKLCYVKCEN